MTAGLRHHEGRAIAHPKRRLHQGRLYYFASAAELADPEWVAKFQRDNPCVKLIENKPFTVK